MQHGAGITPDGQRRRVRNGVRQPHHLDAKGADLGDRAGADLDQRNIHLPAVLGQLSTQQCQRERAAIDRTSKL